MRACGVDPITQSRQSPAITMTEVVEAVEGGKGIDTGGGEGGAKQTFKDLSAGAAGGVAQVLLGEFGVVFKVWFGLGSVFCFCGLVLWFAFGFGVFWREGGGAVEFAGEEVRRGGVVAFVWL